MELQYIVEIICDATDEVVRQIDCGNSMRKAEKVRNGLLININSDNYSVFITIKKAKP